MALGGLETHPDYSRWPLNQKDFRSQIVELNLRRGHLETYGYWPESDGISIRHLAVGAGDRLYFGGQVVDPARARPSQVLGVLDRGHTRSGATFLAAMCHRWPRMATALLQHQRKRIAPFFWTDRGTLMLSD